MKFFTRKDTHDKAIKFLDEWLPDIEKNKSTYMLWDMLECEPLHLDVDEEKLDIIINKLKDKGFKYTIKAIFQGDHFYRDDTAKCPRCYRHRPEIAYDKRRGINDGLCNRCSDILAGN